MLENAADTGQPIDWELLQDYLDLFKLGDKLEELKEWYGTAE
jgi:hypothetical protein